MEQFLENKKYNNKYKNSSDPETFLQKYESQLIIFVAADRMLSEQGIDTKSISSSTLSDAKEHYHALADRKAMLKNDAIENAEAIDELNGFIKNISEPEKEKSASSHDKDKADKSKKQRN